MGHCWYSLPFEAGTSTEAKLCQVRKRKSRTYQEDDTLQGYVIDLQKFERLLKQEVRYGNFTIATIAMLSTSFGHPIIAVQ